MSDTYTCLWCKEVKERPALSHGPASSKVVRAVRRYCSKDCRLRHKEDIRSRKTHMATGTVGAINELLVVVDLMKRGYPVFRALSPSCPCDLVVLIGRRCYRVEVTCGYKSKTGKVIHCKKDESKFDVLAVAMNGGEIYYRGLPLS